ncbi:hypothetical protein [Pontivivens ytuae]|uniref:Uncharacterized protein n=1 Tax=Pontivivens ytuae TaxID=2789856 RepID=A0A7S9LT67_9RHOB|nr:hypothetical protein [Pontivivens ytuae]QPH54748.1 hypothetical protein I0K15_02925 [Pontivivens ytuae]
MDNYDSDKLARDAKAAVDHDDLQNEIAGREVGRLSRFFAEAARNAAEQQRKERERSHEQTALQLILAKNAEYAALYRDTMDLLVKAEAATETALAQADTRRIEAKEALDTLLANAARLEDGTVVFLDAQGRVRDEAGAVLEDISADAVSWPDGAPRYESFEAVRDASETAQAAYDRILHYQVDVLGHARDRLSDEGNPPDLEELEEINRVIREDMPPSIGREMAAFEADVPETAMPTAALDIPKL